MIDTVAFAFAFTMEGVKPRARHGGDRDCRG